MNKLPSRNIGEHLKLKNYTLDRVPCFQIHFLFQAVIHILLNTSDQQIPESLRVSLTAPEIRIMALAEVADAQTALDREVFDSAIIYADEAHSSWEEQLLALRGSGSIFILVLAPVYSVEAEAKAFAAGADMYLAEPVPAQSLIRLLKRQSSTPSGSLPPADTRRSPSQAPFPVASQSPLHILREFSYVLGFSLDYKAFTQHFIIKLRDQVRFSRIGIFLEPSKTHSLVQEPGGRHLECIASHGLPHDLVQCFQLNRQTGIGRALIEQPRVLDLNRIEEGLRDKHYDTIVKEFNVLGCNLAIPLSDRERTIGVAMISGPVSSREYSEDELELLYLLMEELGVAIRNSRLHLELANHGKLIENVLGSITSGAIVVGEDLQLHYANAVARRFLKIDGSPKKRIDFAQLPKRVATAVHSAVEKGESVEPFYMPGQTPGELFKISIFPFQVKGELPLLPQPTMVMIEDFTKIEASKRQALESDREQLISLISERFAHEIRNSLVPLSTHAQLIDQRIEDPKFQKSLKASLLKETARIKRFSEQMLYLAQDPTTGDANVLLQDAVMLGFENAKKYLGLDKAKLQLAEDAEDGRVGGNPEAIAYALEELFLNALQSNPEEPEVFIEITRSHEGILRLRMRDEGSGFMAETVEKAAEPFFTSRNTGVGLGISVAKKLISEHDGFLQLNVRSTDKEWDLEIQLPEQLTQTTHA